MDLHVKFQDCLEEPVVENNVTLHKNDKGYHVKINGKYYFPERNNRVIPNLDQFKDKELWIAITKDNVSYGNFAFAAPDYFVRTNEEETLVWVEKEIPLNHLDREEFIFSWDYLKLASLDNADESEKFIEDLENQKVPEPVIKEAISVFWDRINK